MPPSDGEPASRKRLFLRRIGSCCVGIVLGGFVGLVVGAGIGEATEPPGDYLEGVRTIGAGVVGMLVGAWAGLRVVALIGAVLERRNRYASCS